MKPPASGFWRLKVGGDALALSHGILVSLLDGEMTGYELARSFDTNVGFFWKASHQQIYQELHKLEEAGLITGESVVQTSRPNKNPYTLTEAGLAAIEVWMEKETKPSSAKEELFVKVFAVGRVDTAPLIPEMKRRKALHQERLSLYRKIEAKSYAGARDGGSLPKELLGKYLCLRMGIRHEEGWIAWCDEALEALSKSD